MTLVRMIPTHEIVQQTYPRPPREQDEVPKAIGKAVDAALARFSYEFRQGRRPTSSGMRTLAEAVLDDELEGVGAEISSPEREKALRQIDGVLRAFRQSEIFGLSRPRTRIILIRNEVGVYAQPDFWDGRGRFFEMKTYRAIPPQADVALQMSIFQLAYPRFESVLVCFNRHAEPVEAASLRLPPPTEAETSRVLRLAYEVGRRHGEDKVLEYLDEPTLHYPLPPPPPGEPVAKTSPGEPP